MLKHILVPLDGTSFAEAALPVTSVLAKGLGAKVTLLHLVELSPDPVVHGQRHLTGRAEAERYLGALAQQLAAGGISCDVHVHSDAVDRVAGGIVAHQEELHPDLIVMCTHGPAKLERLLRGSLAQQVVALGQTPLLLVDPENRMVDKPFMLQRLLVALDGDPGHQQGFELACDLAAPCKARLHLLSVVAELSSLAGRLATLSRYLPGSTWVMQGMALQNLRRYLQRLLDWAEGRGLEATGEILYGKTAKTISEAAEAIDADLIVLATHGKAGTQAFWANSVAAQVQGQTTRPLLLLPVKGSGKLI